MAEPDYDPNLLDLLTRMYQAEISFGIVSQWDGGVRVWIGWDEREARRRATFSVGTAKCDLPNWQTLWGSVTTWFASGIVDYYDDLEEWPGDPGCLECTAGTTPNHLNTGWCAYHFAKHKILPPMPYGRMGTDKAITEDRDA